MRYRQLSSTGDYTFGQGAANFLVNSPATVAQAVETTLRLMQGEWFLNTSAGTPYSQAILGTFQSSVYDPAIQQTILGVQGVVSIDAYLSTLNRETRQLTVNATISTIYGQATIEVSL